MASPSPPLEPAPRPPRRSQFLGLAPLEVVLLVLAGLAAGFGLGLLVGSTEATVGATLLGGVLVAAGTFRTIQVARETQLTERVTNAIEQLHPSANVGNPDEVRVLGGIYALERVAAESRLDHYPIMEILSAFVRGRVRLSDGATCEDHDDVPACEHKLPNDVQAALAVLARRSPRAQEYRLDLHATDLRNAKLPHARFARAILSAADLRCADLREADLCGTNLKEAKLRDAQLDGAFYDAHTEWPNDFDDVTEGRYQPLVRGSAPQRRRARLIRTKT
jgi:hypothetical protein